MSNTLLTSIRVISKTHAEWLAQNPILLLTQGAYSTDTKELRIGNGILRWNELPVDVAHGSVASHKDIHRFDGRDPITPEDIGAAPLSGDSKVPVENLPDATTTVKGIVQLNDTLMSTSVEQALTAAQGKVLKDVTDTKESLSNKNVADGYAGLDSEGKIVESLLPSIALTDTYEAASEIEMLALSSARRGDVCIRTDINKTFVLAVDGYDTMSNWKELRTPTDTVTSVAGKIGAVTLVAQDVGLKKITSTQMIAAGTSASLALAPTFDPIEMEYLSVEIKFKDTDNKYYSAISVAYYAIDKVAQQITIFNDCITDLEFVICVRN